MPYSDPADKRAHNREWTRKDRAKKRAAASMTLADRIKAARQLAADAGLPPRKPVRPTRYDPSTRVEEAGLQPHKPVKLKP